MTHLIFILAWSSIPFNFVTIFVMAYSSNPSEFFFPSESESESKSPLQQPPVKVFHDGALGGSNDHYEVYNRDALC
jgi:hypothetical protein